MVGIKDLSALSLVDFEIFPHYSQKYKKTLEKYKKTCKNEVRVIPDSQYLLVEN